MIYANGQSFPGWDFWQDLLIQSVFTISKVFSSTFFFGNILGNKQQYPLKPVNPLFYMMATTFDFQGIAYIIGGTLIVPVAMVAFVPAASLLGQTEPWFYWALIPCVAFTAVGFLLYHKMIKLYESAGG